MAEDRQDLIREKIELYLDYFLSTSDDVQTQIYSLLRVDFEVENPPLGILLTKMRDHKNSLLYPLIEVLFSFENFKNYANDESLRGSQMLQHLVYVMGGYIVPYLSETKSIRFDPWPWLEYFLNDSNRDSELVLFIDDTNFVGTKFSTSIAALLYASLYCDLDTDRQKFSHYINLYNAEYGRSRRAHQCEMIIKGRLDGHSLTEIIDWFD